MPRPKAFDSAEYRLPMYDTNPPPYHSSLKKPPNTPSSISVLISSKATHSTSPTSTAILFTAQKPSRKSLQVHWHPSVNQRQAAKRNRELLSLFALLLFFSSVTFILFQHSGCDFATGQCQRSRHKKLAPPSLILTSTKAIPSRAQGKNRLQEVATSELVKGAGVFGGEGLLMDQDTVVMPESRQERRYPPPISAERTWSALYGLRRRRPLLSQDQDRSAGIIDDSIKQISMDMDTQGDERGVGYDEEEVYDTEGTSIDNENEKVQNEGDMEEEDLVMEAGRGRATPQEAYADIWKESPDPLSEDDYLELENNYVVASRIEETHQQQSIRSRLGRDTQYMMYLPDADMTNQFHSMVRAIMLAKSLGRTLILPPITVSPGQDNSQRNQPWSDFFDLETFMYLTGAKVVELQTLREPDSLPMTAEPLQCHITCGVGSLRPVDATAKEFLKQWKFDLSMIQQHGGTQEGGLESVWAVLLFHAGRGKAFPENGLYRDAHPAGTDFHANNNNNPTTTRPYISIHARRGEYIEFCQQHFQYALQSCLPTTQELASTLHDILVANPSLRGLPVFVSTDEDRPEELTEFRALGWHVLDHKAIGTRERMGAFGPMMMDQMFMAQAQVFLGVRTSASSRLGAHRQEDWYGRKAVFM
ncbi:hypothetical protein BC939DRAFT_452230 [Gamsiella multidivaricata]|uniref:uncharacterized protein n=1 Tax=Gamsiella multidivaricata TaxID=101098 RepID=UPI00221FCD8C|nr:uncharacterized protein BC939DRAFT_452230 [Gamsiella multidivaricata]KAI7823238.1 hypothetical protein BC939DRAFT_452230 [Gamsiella multidivaricata]